MTADLDDDSTPMQGSSASAVATPGLHGIRSSSAAPTDSSETSAGNSQAPDAVEDSPPTATPRVHEPGQSPKGKATQESADEPSHGSPQVSKEAALKLAELFQHVIEGFDIYEQTTEGVRNLASPPQEPVARHERRLFMFFQPKTAAKKARDAARMNGTALSTAAADRYDYEQKYPEDEEGKGMDPNARVWRVYLDEAAHFDLDFVENIRDTVDGTLVFAGLFSAVVGGLLTQVSTALKPDYAQVTAALLIELISVQRAMIAGSMTGKVEPSALNLDSPSTASSPERWVNGLWFVSLSLSLSTALLSVLVKQWIQSYVSPTFGTAQEQARVRHYRYMGIERWHVPLIAGLLPILLHLSLFLFFTGLVALLFTLDIAVGGVVGCIGLLTYTAYFVANLLPLHYPECPYKTPLSTYAYVVVRMCTPIVSPAWRILCDSSIWRPLRNELHQIASAFSVRADVLAWEGQKQRDSDIRRCYCEGKEFQDDKPVDTSNEREHLHVKLSGDDLDSKMLGWLCKTSTNPSIRIVISSAVSDLRVDYPAATLSLLRTEILAHMCSALQDCLGTHYQVRDGSEKRTYWLLHAHLQLRARHCGSYPLLEVPACPCFPNYTSFQEEKIREQESRLVAFRYAMPTTHGWTYPKGLLDPQENTGFQERVELLLSSTTSSALRIAILHDSLVLLLGRNHPTCERDYLFEFLRDLSLLEQLCTHYSSLLHGSSMETSTATPGEGVLLFAYVCHYTCPSLDLRVQDHPQLNIGLDLARRGGQASLVQLSRDDIDFEAIFRYYHSQTVVQIIINLVKASPSKESTLHSVAKQLLPLQHRFDPEWVLLKPGPRHNVPNSHPLVHGDVYLQQLIPTPHIIQTIIADPDTDPALIGMIALLLQAVMGWRRRQVNSYHDIISSNVLEAMDIMVRWCASTGNESLQNPLMNLPGLVSDMFSALFPSLRAHCNYALEYLANLLSWVFARIGDDRPMSALCAVIRKGIHCVPHEQFNQAWEDAISRFPLLLLREAAQTEVDLFVQRIRTIIKDEQKHYTNENRSLLAAVELSRHRPVAAAASNVSAIAMIKSPPTPMDTAGTATASRILPSATVRLRGKVQGLLNRSTRIEQIVNLPLSLMQAPPSARGAAADVDMGSERPATPHEQSRFEEIV